jgi:hypothetical protein
MNREQLIAASLVACMFFLTIGFSASQTSKRIQECRIEAIKSGMKAEDISKICRR